MYNFDAQKTFAGLAVAEALMRPAQLPVLRDGHRGYHCTRCLLAFSFFLSLLWSSLFDAVFITRSGRFFGCPSGSRPSNWPVPV